MGFLQEHRDRLKNFLDKLTNDSHVPIAIFVFGVTMTYVWHTGKDLPPGFVSSLYAFYGFLGGHALVYQKWPDQQAPTTVVNVDNDNSNTNTANANAAPTPAPAPAPPAPATGSDQAKG
jgi:hypothetical protein